MSQKIKAVAVIITNDQDQLLLVQRGPLARSHHGQWENVGGEVEEGEDPVLAAKREVMEEIGVEVEITGEMLEMKDVQLNGEVWLAKVFKGQIVDQEPLIQEEGKHTAVRWFDKTELATVDLSPYAREDFEQLGWVA